VLHEVPLPLRRITTCYFAAPDVALLEVHLALRLTTTDYYLTTGDQVQEVPKQEVPNHRRNECAQLILNHGFVEAPALFPVETCAALNALSRDRAVFISNALQLTVVGSALRLIRTAVTESPVIKAAVLAVYGTDQCTVPKDSVKILHAEPGTQPQIPHADDTCNRELFGVVHLKPKQRATECARYKSADWPVEPSLTAQCTACQRWVVLSDWHARRRDHCLKQFVCGTVGQECHAPDGDDNNDAQVYEAFRELIDDPAGVIADMLPCGQPEGCAGDGILALPTLLHRGPGTMDLPAGEAGRTVCFFSVRPKFSGERAELNGFGTYDPDKQVHGAWLLWRLGAILDKRTKHRVVKAYAQLGYSLSAFSNDIDASVHSSAVRDTSEKSKPCSQIPKRGPCGEPQPPDCGECAYCKDKRKFGGPNKLKKACAMRQYSKRV